MSSTGELDARGLPISGPARGQGEARLFVAEGASAVLGNLLDVEGEAVAESLGWGYEDIDLEQMVGSTPSGRVGRPDEMARMAVIPISDDSSYGAGAEFVADGGMLA